jgi:hypothetical protein
MVHRANVLPDDAAQARALARLDPRREVILDAPPPLPPAETPAGDWQPARLVSADRHHLRIEADAPSAAILVVSEVWYPGWSVTVDGVAAPLLRADYAFRGVALPAGKHVVEMRFVSRPTRLGLELSAVGLLGLLALAVIGRLRPRVIQ